MTLPFKGFRLSASYVLALLGLLVICSGLPTSSLSASGKSTHNEAGGLFIPVSRSELVILPQDISEVIVADPDVADVHVIGAKRVAFIGKKIGRTNAKILDRNNKILRQFDIIVGYDLPEIRRSLHSFLPHEHIGVELVNTNIALVGEVSDAAVAEKAVRIVQEFITPASSPTSGTGGQGGGQAAQGTNTTLLNLLKVTSGQQVMLRVRVGEIKRTALKNLGVNLSGFHIGGDTTLNGGTFNQLGNVQGTPTTPFGTVTSGNGGGLLSGVISSNDWGLSASLEALETQGLFKILAEPNLVAMSGEKAEFLAGGEFPIQVPQPGGVTTINTVQFKQFGVAVQFVPYVLSENRIRIAVQPEVSEIDLSNAVGGVPGLSTRRAKTTVELAPGESFMIAGLISDRLNSSLNQIPGASELPIIGALLRSTAYQRNETELVIAVTPYIVDPLKSSDVRLPTDDFRPSSTMEQFFYGALGSMSGNAYRVSQTPNLEGPIGFMTD